MSECMHVRLFAFIPLIMASSPVACLALLVVDRNTNSPRFPAVQGSHRQPDGRYYLYGVPRIAGAVDRRQIRCVLPCAEQTRAVPRPLTQILILFPSRRHQKAVEAEGVGLALRRR